MKKNLFIISALLIFANAAWGYSRTVENATSFTVQVTATFAEVGPCDVRQINVEPGKSITIADPVGKISSATYPCSLVKLQARVLNKKNNGQGEMAEQYNGPHNADANFIVAGTQDGPFAVTRDVF